MLSNAGANKKELQLVLDNYSQEKDSLKLKAAVFLIKNMKEFISSKTNTSSFYKDFSFQVGKLSDSLFTLSASERKHEFRNSHYDRIKSIWNSLKNAYGFNAHKVKKQLDINVVTSEMLIENIELSFNVWEMPWAKKLSFEEFCEYILPYRGFGEPAVKWRKEYYKKNIWVKDSMMGSKDRIRACNFINNDLKKWFFFNKFFMDKYPGGQNPKMLLESKVGKCVDQVNLSIYSMRSIGLPVTMDYTPLWANSNNGHTWNALLLENGTSLNFQGASPSNIGVGKEQRFYYNLSKVYRKTFSENMESLSNKISNYENIPITLRGKHFIDVTGDYKNVFKSKTIRLPIKNENSISDKYAYLCTFNNSKWVAVAWSEIKNGYATFKNMGVGVTYLLAYYKKGNYTPINAPFILTDKDELQHLTPVDSFQDIRLERKFPLREKMKRMLWPLKNGIFQGANKSDFSDAQNIYEIDEKEVIKPFYVIKEIDREKAYRYVRFIPKIKTEIAELSFFSFNKILNKHEILHGNVISSVKNSETLIAKMFDDRMDNYFSYTEKENTWYGLDLKEPRIISQVGYCPRNDTNNIEPDNLYELFYWNEGWKSLGQQKAKFYYLDYKNVPKNALLWLRNLTKGKEERIFTYEKGQQVWW
ncbi:transglutaminase domain-containing protein [uncultured Maribacter sp.]|uniref:transglutaminase domain-containing protein n=1 Tax=uncultured Maribacter sp. TaxID=431308 RepID=UPI002603213D|nr:transglutaminase domain-containing protein [uncultured Maribacter sp.]